MLWEFKNNKNATETAKKITSVNGYKIWNRFSRLILNILH